jgi:acyl-CoA reductase-like NAD-dependent aldehyde dehydrogenase
VETGRKVLSALGDRLKPAVAELSGVDPMLVCADADLDRAVDAAVWGRLVAAGQTCMAPRRIYIERPAYGAFLDLALARVRALRVGDPRDASTEVGPLRTERLRTEAAAAIAEARSLGARLLWGGEAPDLGGCYLTPALLSGCDERMRVFREDLLAPILAVTPVATMDEAVTRANASPFGLTASVWTRHRARGEALARRLRGGVVSVNEMIVGAADPGTPFGGTADSGYGRTRGAEGLREMVQPRVMEHGAPAFWPRRHQFPYRHGTLPLLRAAIRLCAENGPRRLYSLRALLTAVRRYNRDPPGR